MTVYTTMNIATAAGSEIQSKLANGTQGQVLTATAGGAASWTTSIGDTAGVNALNLRCGTGDVTISSASGTLVKILDTGEMTKPLQPAFLAYCSANILNVTGDGTDYNIVFDTEEADQGGNFNTGTGTFTAPVAGFYQFNAIVGIYGMLNVHTAGYVMINISGSNSQLVRLNPYACREMTNNYIMMSASLAIRMLAGGTARVIIQVNGGTKVICVVGGGTFTKFSGFLAC